MIAYDFHFLFCATPSRCCAKSRSSLQVIPLGEGLGSNTTSTVGLIHDNRHVCFYIIMQIRQVISEGANKLQSRNFNWFLIMSDNNFHTHALVSVLG